MKWKIILYFLYHIFRVDYIPHPLEKPYHHHGETYKAPEGEMDMNTNYLMEFTSKYRVVEIRIQMDPIIGLAPNLNAICSCPKKFLIEEQESMIIRQMRVWSMWGAVV